MGSIAYKTYRHNNVHTTLHLPREDAMIRFHSHVARVYDPDHIAELDELIDAGRVKVKCMDTGSVPEEEAPPSVVRKVKAKKKASKKKAEKAAE